VLIYIQYVNERDLAASYTYQTLSVSGITKTSKVLEEARGKHLASPFVPT
jgi:hypothetical protein